MQRHCEEFPGAAEDVGASTKNIGSLRRMPRRCEECRAAAKDFP
jgi:hypothetical protein